LSGMPNGEKIAQELFQAQQAAAQANAQPQ